jgi:hypothetical protein
MKSKTISKIRDMGYDLSVSIEEIDDFVDACISFLRRTQEADPEMDFDEEIFNLEDARQKALLNKYCLTVQPLKD